MKDFIQLQYGSNRLPIDKEKVNLARIRDRIRQKLKSGGNYKAITEVSEELISKKIEALHKKYKRK